MSLGVTALRQNKNKSLVNNTIIESALWGYSMICPDETLIHRTISILMIN